MKLFFSKFLLSLFAVVLTAGIAYGQRQLTGTVTDAETGEPLIGASVMVPGTTTGVATDLNGSFTLTVSESATQLRITYTGYAEQTVAIGASNIQDIRLEPNAAVNEVLVIGYGTVRREDATGSVVAVSTKDFNKGAIVAPQELIAGKVAGVQVTPAPEAGGAPTIRIRGGSSLTATNDPLIIIDGVPVDNNGVAGARNPLNILNPNDVETFTVLKDASATAIYGSRASNGVIIITTKKGSLANTLKVDYSGMVSVSNNINEVDVLSGNEYRELINERFADGHPSRALLGTANTNWQDEIYQTGIGQDHALGLSGAIAKVPYRVGLGYTNRTGTLRTDELERFTASLRLTPSFLDNTLQVSLGAKVVNDNNRFADRGAIGAAVAFDPTQPVRAEGNDDFGGFFTWKQADGTPNPIAPSNPVARLEQTNDRGESTRFLLNGSADYRFWFLRDLRLNINAAYDRSESDGTVAQPANAAFVFNTGGRIRRYAQEKENTLFESYLSYNKVLSRDHRFDVMGGYSWQRFYIRDFGFAYSADDASELEPGNADPREYFLLSLFGRLNYTFQDRYLLTATLRRDGSSRFGPDNRWGLFPSVALGVKIIEDNDAKVSNLKLRVSYGETGQQDIGNTTREYYAYLASYLSSLNTAQYQLGSDFFTTLRPGGYDANIKWETTVTYNAAVDYGFFANRLYGTVEVYHRETRDLLNFVPVPAGTNLTNFITTNVGDLTNTGVEFSLNVVPIRNERSTWEIGGNVTFNRNEITRLTATDDPNYLGVFTGGISGGVGNTIQIHSVGFPARSFYVYEQVYDESGTPIEGLYVDRNGDGTVTPADRYRYENPAPDVFFGFYSNYTRGAWDFSFAGRANVGNYVYANIESEGAYYNRLYNASGFLGNVQSEIRNNDLTVPQYFSDHFIRNASFLRIDHITLGYNLTNLGFISNLRLYTTVQNPFVITQYEGLDPEIFDGIDNNLYPRARTFVFGVTAGF